MNIYKEPKVTVISVPEFREPKHMHVNWNPIDAEDPDTQSASAQLIEFAGRLCYMSQNNPANKTTKEYIRNILEQAHGSVLEHANISVLIEQISRSCSHEIVRHRAGFAYSQLSQRYVDESDVGFVMPPAIMEYDDIGKKDWELDCWQALCAYRKHSEILMNKNTHIEDKKERRKTAHEAARSVLPNATETKMVMTGNIRSWRHFLTMRGSKHADAEIRNLAIAIYNVLTPVCPEGFQDMFVTSDGEVSFITVEYNKV